MEKARSQSLFISFLAVIAVYLLFAFPISADAQSCSDLFVIDSGKTVGPGVLQAKWWYTTLIQDGEWEKIKNSNIATDHNDFLATALQKIFVEFEHKVSFQEFPQQADWFKFIRNLVNDAIKMKRVSRVFYETIAVLISDTFSEAVVNKNMAHTESAKMKLYKSTYDEVSKRFSQPYMQKTLSIFATMSFYDIIEFWPELYPEGVILSDVVHFDTVTGDSPEFKGHDRTHNHSFHVYVWEVLSSTERENFHSLIKFLRAYRKELTSEEEGIIGDFFGNLMHERLSAQKMMEMFSLNFEYEKDKMVMDVVYGMHRESVDTYIKKYQTYTLPSEIGSFESFKNNFSVILHKLQRAYAEFPK